MDRGKAISGRAGTVRGSSTTKLDTVARDELETTRYRGPTGAGQPAAARSFAETTRNRLLANFQDQCTRVHNVMARPTRRAGSYSTNSGFGKTPRSLPENYGLESLRGLGTSSSVPVSPRGLLWPVARPRDAGGGRLPVLPRQVSTYKLRYIG